MKKNIEIIGWFGVFLIFLAYTLLSFGYLEVKSYLYNILNLLGAFGIVLESYSKKNYQPVILNLFWGFIAIISLIKLIFYT